MRTNPKALLVTVAALFGAVANFDSAVAQAIESAEQEVLAEAWQYFQNAEKRQRKQALEKFGDYLERYPHSPFAPEVFYHMGTLYGSKRNHALGEKPDVSMIRHYFDQAAKGYQWRFSPYANAVRSTLVNSPRATLAEKTEYYDWLKRLQSDQASAEDVYPVNTISRVLKGHPLQIDANSRVRSLEAFRDPLESYAKAASINIVDSTNDPDELRALEARYPDALIGRLAADKRAGIDRAINQALDHAVRSDLLLQDEYAIDLSQDQRPANDADAAPTRATPPPKVESPSTGDGAAPEGEGKDRTAVIVAGLGAAVVVVGALLGSVRARTRPAA